MKGKDIFIRLWESPTFNTWLSYSTKTLSLFVVLPLILKRFSEGEVAIWYLFATIIALQGLADIGFKTTFVRAIAFAMGGAKSLDLNFKNSNSPGDTSNWELVERIFSIMKKIYVYLAIIFFILLVTAGSWSMVKPIMAIQNRTDAWAAWLIVCCVSALKFYTTIYANYLEGLNKIALVRRWEALTSIGAILTSIAFLIIFRSLLSLVIANQIWVLINALRDFVLCRKVENGKFNTLTTSHAFDKEMFGLIWRPAWRSGISGFMSNGLTSLTSIVYAQIGDTKTLAGYLLALRLMSQVKEVSMAPFYSKIPTFSRLRSQGKISEIIRLAQNGMKLSHLVFVSGAILVGIFGQELLRIIGSNVQFIDINLWLLLTAAFFIHRFGAMHIQLYSTTNHIVSHIADGVSGIIYILATLLLLDKLGLYAIPSGMLLGYLGFYAPFSMYFSYRSMQVGVLHFEKKAVFPSLLILVFYFLCIKIICYFP